jgi:hypothetical protein
MNIRMEPCVSGAKRHPRTISNSRRAKFKRLGTVDRQRDVVAQRAVSKGRADDAGHLAAHQFGGPEAPYVSIQNYQQNQGGGPIGL